MTRWSMFGPFLFYHNQNGIYVWSTDMIYMLYIITIYDCTKSGIWQLLSIHLMCLSCWFCHLITDFPFWIFLGVQYFCDFYFLCESGSAHLSGAPEITPVLGGSLFLSLVFCTVICVLVFIFWTFPFFSSHGMAGLFWTYEFESQFGIFRFLLYYISPLKIPVDILRN